MYDISPSSNWCNLFWSSCITTRLYAWFWYEPGCREHKWQRKKYHVEACSTTPSSDISANDGPETTLNFSVVKLTSTNEIREWNVRLKESDFSATALRDSGCNTCTTYSRGNGTLRLVCVIVRERGVKRTKLKAMFEHVYCLRKVAMTQHLHMLSFNVRYTVQDYSLISSAILG